MDFPVEHHCTIEDMDQYIANQIKNLYPLLEEKCGYTYGQINAYATMRMYLHKEEPGFNPWDGITQFKNSQ